MTARAVVPVTFYDASAFVRMHHRHNGPVRGWKFGAGLAVDGWLVGVVMVGRPVSRVLAAAGALEVTRCCTDGTRNACSQLYGWAIREARRRGVSRLYTYTRCHESGSSLVAAGWRRDGVVKGRSWANRPLSAHASGDKVRWLVVL